MLPRETIATAQIPGGDTLTLVSHGRDFIIMLGRDELMGTRMQFSEEQLALLTLERLTAPAPRILIGGYGMGFTYRAALAKLPPKGQIVVAEVVPEIIDWARGPLAHLTGNTLADPHGEVVLCDVAAIVDHVAAIDHRVLEIGDHVGESHIGLARGDEILGHRRAELAKSDGHDRRQDECAHLFLRWGSIAPRQE